MRWWALSVAALLILFVGIGIGGAGEDTPTATTVAESEATTTTEPDATTTTTEATTTTTRATTTTTTAVVEPTAENFAIELTILESECFNTAGGLVTIRPELSYDGPDLTQDYTLTYSIDGGEHPNDVYRIEVQADGNYRFDEEVISTLDCDAVLTPRVVAVIG
jgi:hypothetical protein